MIASCKSGSYLASAVAEHYRGIIEAGGNREDFTYLGHIDFQFSDFETCVRLEADVSGQDVFLFQGLYVPDPEQKVDQNLMSFLIAARTFREWGASRVTAVLPYLAYARQDNPTRSEREPTTAKLVADLATEAGIARLVTLHPHCKIHGLFGKIPVLSLESLPLFIEEFSRFRGRDDVITVAPDAGASKFVAVFARALGIRGAIASKYRPKAEKAAVHEVIGDFGGKRIAIVLDDMISSGGTAYAVIRHIVEEKGIEDVYIGVTHNLCMNPALERLAELNARYHLKEVITTDSIPQSNAFLSLPFARVVSLSPMLTNIVYGIHHDLPVSEAVT